MHAINYFFGAFYITLRHFPVFIIFFFFQLLFFSHKIVKKKKMVINALFILYLSVLVDITGLDDIRVSLLTLLRGGLVTPNLIPFINMDIKQAFMNVLLFVPLGFFLLKIFKNKKWSVLKILIVSFTLSFIIELLQLSGGRCFDVDDIIMNIIGGIGGYGITKKCYIYEKQKLEAKLFAS